MALLSALLLGSFLLHEAPSIANADTEFSKIDYPATAAICDTLLRRTPDDAGVLWRLARVNVAMGEMASGEDRERLFREAQAYAEKCVRVDSSLAVGHTWLAAALGNVAMYEGGKTKIRLAYEIKRQLDIALALNPRDDIAWSILGSYYRALGNVSWIERQLAAIFLGSLPDGGYEQADSALQRAVSLAPNVLRHRFELAKLYRDWGRTQDFRKELDTAATMPVLLASDRRTLGIIRRMRESGN